MAGRIAGPAYRTSLAGGWSVLADADYPDEFLPLAVAARAAGSKRRSSVLALWRGDGTADGVVIFDGTVPAAGLAWNTGWRYVTGRDTHEADRAADALAAQFDLPNTELIALRALLRATERASDPLAELAQILSLPPTC
jgi:hypothetical protein